jgi:uncharacterized protein (TIRG00374 family)
MWYPPSGRRRHVRGVVGIVVVAVAVGGLAVAGHSVLGEALATFAHLRWIWIPPALLAEALSMGAFARMQRHLFRVNGVRMRLTSTLAVTYAANAVSLSLPIAGPAASVGYAYTQFRRLGADSAATSWTLGISWVVSTFTLGVVLAVGALTSGNTTTAVIGLASAVVAIVPLVGLLVALRNSRARAAVGRLAMTLWTMVGRIGRRPDDEWAAALPVDPFLDDLATVRMSAASYLHVGALSLLNWSANALCLVFAILATGGDVPWHGLLLAYAVGTGAALLPLTPGGVGVVELALAAALVIAGMHGPHALAAVLVYRIISFWLVIAIGWVIAAALFRSNRITPIAQPNRPFDPE